jgi:hypothetical protein
MKQKTGHPPCVWMMWYSLLRTALGPMERKTFVPVQAVRQERVEVEQQEQVQLLGAVPRLPVWSLVAQARKHRQEC